MGNALRSRRPLRRLWVDTEKGEICGKLMELNGCPMCKNVRINQFY